jgi:hypothetical protein
MPSWKKVITSGSAAAFSSLTVSLPITGSLSGSTTVGNNLITLPNPSAVTYLRVNADNTVTPRTPAEVLTDLGVATTLILGKNMSGSSLVNTTTNTAVFSAAIPANTLQANDFIEVFTQISTTVLNGTDLTVRMYINNANNVTNASLLATFNNTVGTGNTGFSRNLFVTAAGVNGNIRTFNSSVNLFLPNYNLNNQPLTNVAIDTTVNQWLIIAVQMGNNTSTTTLQGSIARLTR